MPFFSCLILMVWKMIVVASDRHTKTEVLAPHKRGLGLASVATKGCEQQETTF